MKKLFITTIAVFIGMITGYAQNSFEINFNDLSKDIQKYISKNYAGYAIDKAMQQQDKKGNISFTDVYISKGTEKTKLIFDKKDEFVKKEAVAAAAPAQQDKAAQPAKPDSAAVKAPAPQAPAPADTTKK